MTRLLDAQTVAITMNLAGTFTPNEELYAMSVRAAELNDRIVERTKAAGGLRADVEVDDLSLILEQVSSIRLGDASRTRELRRRYLALFLDGLRTTTGRRCPVRPRPRRSSPSAGRPDRVRRRSVGYGRRGGRA